MGHFNYRYLGNCWTHLPWPKVAAHSSLAKGYIQLYLVDIAHWMVFPSIYPIRCAMFVKFLKKTVRLCTRGTFLGVAVPIFVIFFAIPNSLFASSSSGAYLTLDGFNISGNYSVAIWRVNADSIFAHHMRSYGDNFQIAFSDDSVVVKMNGGVSTYWDNQSFVVAVFECADYSCEAASDVDDFISDADAYAYVETLNSGIIDCFSETSNSSCEAPEPSVPSFSETYYVLDDYTGGNVMSVQTVSEVDGFDVVTATDYPYVSTDDSVTYDLFANTADNENVFFYHAYYSSFNDNGATICGNTYIPNNSSYSYIEKVEFENDMFFLKMSPDDIRTFFGSDTELERECDDVVDNVGPYKKLPIASFFSTDDVDLTFLLDYDSVLQTFLMMSEGSYAPPNISAILSMSPSATTTATSTDFEFRVTGQLLPEDFEDGSELRVTYYRQTNTQMAGAIYSQVGVAPDSGVFVVPLIEPGYFDFSTTTSVLSVGDYWYTAELDLPSGFFETIVDFFDFTEDLQEKALRMNTMFTVVEQTGIDLLYSDPDYVITDGTFGNFLSNVDFDSCSIISGDFSVIDCLKLLIVPPTPTLVSQWDSLMNNVLRVFPLGYVTRFLEIVTLSDSVQPPALQYTYGTSAPDELQGREVSFQVFDGFALLPEIVADDGSGKNVWDIVTPFFDTIVALGVLGVILADVLRLGLPDFSGATPPQAVEVQPYRVSGVVRKKEHLAPRGAHKISIRDNTN
jgi:hypothetical protein